MHWLLEKPSVYRLFNAVIGFWGSASLTRRPIPSHEMAKLALSDGKRGQTLNSCQNPR